MAKSASNTIVSTEWNAATGKMVFTVKDHGRIELDIHKMSEANRNHALFDRLKAKVIDTAAIGRADASGAIIPEATRTKLKFEAMLAEVEHLESGTEAWNRGGGGGGRAWSDAKIIEALVRVQKSTPDAMRSMATSRAEKLGKTYRQYLDHIATATAVRQAMRDIEDERLAATTPAVNPDDELAAMGE